MPWSSLSWPSLFLPKLIINSRVRYQFVCFVIYQQNCLQNLSERFSCGTSVMIRIRFCRKNFDFERLDCWLSVNSSTYLILSAFSSICFVRSVIGAVLASFEFLLKYSMFSEWRAHWQSHLKAAILSLKASMSVPSHETSFSNSENVTQGLARDIPPLVRID